MVPLNFKYHIKSEDQRFIRVNKDVFRVGKIFRECIDKTTGIVISKELIKENHARVMYPIEEGKIDG
jgi:vancomycin resistance protein VanW